MYKENKIVGLIAVIGILIVVYSAWENYLGEKGKAWKVFQNYITASGAHDKETMQALSYRLSDVCEANFESQECTDRMDTVFVIGREFKKQDFNIWADERQIVLVADWNEDNTEETIIRMRQIIYFVKEDGAIKMLAFKPWQGTFMVKDKENPRPKEELWSLIRTYTDDLDQDGIDDYLEQCLSSSQDETCVQTDPKLRDTDGDGYWDGLEPFLIEPVAE